MTREEFRSLVDEKVKAGSSFVKAVYTTMDEAAATENHSQWACHKGCSACCYQMVTVTSGEIDAIVDYLNGLEVKKRQPIMARVWKRVDEHLAWFKRLGGETNPYLCDPVQLHEMWGRKACPFLNANGACSVHPARPMDCRTMHSRSVCYKKGWQPSDVKRMPNDYEGEANNMVLEHEEEVLGRMAVGPIHHWLAQRKKRIKS